MLQVVQAGEVKAEDMVVLFLCLNRAKPQTEM
jgi:hypothetical protein